MSKHIQQQAPVVTDAPVVQAPPPPVVQAPPSRSAKFTYYDPTTGGGACDGIVYRSYDMIVAMSDDILKCGATIRLTASNGNSVVVRAVDKCDMNHGCQGNSIDATPGVWGALGMDLGIGRTSIGYTIL